MPGKTPVIDSLAANGMLFRNAWSQPVCSPTRSAMLSGRYAFRTGLGYVIQYSSSKYELNPEEISIPDLLSPAYVTAAVGKWHLAAQAVSGPNHPQLLGFDNYSGNLTPFPGPFGNGYFNFEKVVNGATTQSTVYSTTEIVDDALNLISSFSKPWFMWMAFNAPHSPFHKPPAALHGYDLPANIHSSIPVHGRAMLEAMDTEIGRLVASMDPSVLANTLIIFAGDNGTDPWVVTPPFDPSKA